MEKFFADLPEEVQARWEELHKKGNKEVDKQKKRNALINSCVPRDKSAKASGTVAT